MCSTFGSKAELCSFHEADHETDQAACTEIQNETETLKERRRTISSTMLGVSKKKEGVIYIWNSSETYRWLSLGSLKKRHMTRMAGVACLSGGSTYRSVYCARVRVFIQHYIFMHWLNERSLEGVWSVSHACR